MAKKASASPVDISHMFNAPWAWPPTPWLRKATKLLAMSALPCERSSLCGGAICREGPRLCEKQQPTSHAEALRKSFLDPIHCRMFRFFTLSQILRPPAAIRYQLEVRICHEKSASSAYRLFVKKNEQLASTESSRQRDLSAYRPFGFCVNFLDAPCVGLFLQIRSKPSPRASILPTIA